MKQAILWKEFDLKTPVVDILTALKGEKHLFLLESSMYEPSMGRYSFIGCDPFAVVASKGKTISIKLEKNSNDILSRKK
jgi:anthranilate/para-aminobenzoate synthase component I